MRQQGPQRVPRLEEGKTRAFARRHGSSHGCCLGKVLPEKARDYTIAALASEPFCKVTPPFSTPAHSKSCAKILTFLHKSFVLPSKVPVQEVVEL